MSEIMRPLPFSALIDWVLGEYKNHGSVFGIREEKFFRSKGNGAAIGPAAGPHSQLAQNILASFLAGARFIELKTVQIMDGEELRKAVARPCISAIDEGYNVEWSTELTVPEALEEYVKGWFLCRVFAKEFELGDSSFPVFNMSVGYNLEGIKSKKIDDFIEGLKNASNTKAWKECYDYISDNIGSFRHFSKKNLEEIPHQVSGGITLSTLHGCPREEIEKIASYLICEKGLDTFVKCNPTLLGYEKARRLLDEMGYGYVSFDDHHFNNDLKFEDAVDMLGRLSALADKHGRNFGVKLTNTFPVEIHRNELPGNEMYMSGRPLFALSLNVAKILSDAFDGKLPISYSGGADYFNLDEILGTGISPVTLATNILKPGGYERFTQLAELAEKTIKKIPQNNKTSVINVKALTALVESLPGKNRYRKEYRQFGDQGSAHSSLLTPNSSFPTPNCSLLTAHCSLPIFDCFAAPCMETDSRGDGGCPIHQKIPDYLGAVAAADYAGAFRIIARDNTAPSITGTICDHQCQLQCTRVDYEDAMQIRQAKLIAADNAQEDFISALKPAAIKTDASAAVIGAGPAGIAAAVFLRRNGVSVTVYEKRDRPFGIVQYVIPSFRISDEAIYRDFQMAEKQGVEFIFNTPAPSVSELQKKHRFIIIAAGAWKEGASPVKRGSENIIDALRFLEDSRKSNCSLNIGKRVAIIGAGDVAMDCSRAVKRNRGVESAVIVYRRTREFMPSRYEEQELVLADGVEIMELLSPESFSGGVLDCNVMRLGDFDSTGRRSVVETGEKKSLRFDTVIGAVGARVDSGIFTANGINLNDRGFPAVNGSCESSVDGVYVAGDCRAGAATVVRAIADGKAAAADILKKLKLAADFSAGSVMQGCVSTSGAESVPGAESAACPDFTDLYEKKGIIAEAKKDNTDGYRCLICNSLCEICADICPNRANVMIEQENGKHQIVHIDRMCNECGNCSTFCPWTGKPYKDKFTIFSCEEDFKDSENPGFLKTGPDSYRLRLEDKTVREYRWGDKGLPEAWISMIQTIETKYGYMIITE